jgi:hypothetical protein
MSMGGIPLENVKKDIVGNPLLNVLEGVRGYWQLCDKFHISVQISYVFQRAASILWLLSRRYWNTLLDKQERILEKRDIFKRVTP